MKTKSIGVVVGRFQTPYLHHGHLRVLHEAYRRHQVLCVVLGTHGGVPNDRYPLDIEARKRMIQMIFPDAVILSIEDMPSNEVWSEKLDEKLLKEFEDCKITLYGSRDSFLKYYSGKFPYRYVNQIEHKSATEIREKECKDPLNTIEFRVGAIYAAMSRFPIVYNTVDVAVYRQKEGSVQVLLGEKKSDGGKLRFIGGFLDPKDESIAHAAKRELWEEVGMIEVSPMEYIGSMRVDDHRYKRTRDSVMSTLFITKYLWGAPTAKDDIDDVHWVDIESLLDRIANGHKEMALLFKENIEKKF